MVDKQISKEDLQAKNSPQREGFKTRSKQMKNKETTGEASGAK